MDGCKLNSNLNAKPSAIQQPSETVSMRRSCNGFFVENPSISQKVEMTPVNHTSIRNLPRPIAPKIQGSVSTKRKFFMEPYIKKEEKRRATHNEIERRRRNKINNWIFKLRDLIPEETGTDLHKDLQSKTGVSDSKCHILIRACEYIKQIEQDLKSLRECQALNDTLRSRNEQLQLEVQHLKSSNFKQQNQTIK